MNTVVKKFALAALCSTALTGVSQAAVLFDIVGGGAVPTFTYSTNIGSNNVINAAGVTATGSTVLDTGASAPVRGVANSGSAWIGSTAVSNASLAVSGLSATGTGYTISWTYIGNEAGNNNVFSIGPATATSTVAVNSVAPTPGDNRNNNCAGCSSVNPAPTVFLGQTIYTNGVNTTATPGFTLTDTTPPGASVSNTGVAGSNPPPNGGAANLIFAYLTPDVTGTPGIIWDLTTTATNAVVFGFNDNGSPDDNHDDWMGIAQVVGGGLEGTPIPGALPLFGTVLGGGFLVRRLRKRKAQATAA